MRTPPLRLDCDVVVVGSGAGGGVTAAELAEAGLDVVVLEEGPHHTTEEFRGDATWALRNLYRDGGVSVALGDPPVQFQEGRCVGGSTVVNGAMAWRTPDHVLDTWHRQHGLDAILPADMDRHFARVERFISATPHDADAIVARDQQLLRAGAEAKGWKVVEDVRGQVHCSGCNVCTLGCPTGAKQSVLVSYLPRAQAFGARVFANARVERVLMDGRRAVGVRGRAVNPDRTPGRRFEVRARAVVVAAGAIQTPALLLRSGVRPPSGRLGRDLAMHPNAKVLARFDEPVDGWKGVHQAFQVREFQNDGIILASVNLTPGFLAASISRYGDELAGLMEGYRNLMAAGVLVDDTSRGRVVPMGDGRPVVIYQLNDRDLATILRGLGALVDLLFAAGARDVMLPFDVTPRMVGPDEARRILADPPPKRSLEVFTVHVMGTAGMGSDPVRHVCDPSGRVHQTDALYVADASLFPTPIGVNPMLTIMALATRNAERLAETRGAAA